MKEKTLKEHLIDECNISCDFYETKYNCILTKIENHNMNKPLKIFIRKYNIWKCKKDMLYKQLDDITIKKNKSYKDLEEALYR